MGNKNSSFKRVLSEFVEEVEEKQVEEKRIPRRNVVENLDDGFYRDEYVRVIPYKDRFPNSPFYCFFTGTIKDGNIVGYALIKRYHFGKDSFGTDEVVFFENRVVSGHFLATHRVYPDRFVFGYASKHLNVEHIVTDNERALYTANAETPDITEISGSGILPDGRTITYKTVKNVKNNTSETTNITPFVPFAYYDTYNPSLWMFLLDETIIGRTERDVRDPSHPDFVHR